VSVATFIVAKVWLSWGRYLGQDEFESLHQGWLLYSGALQYLDFNSNHPPLAFALLGALNYLTADTVVLIRLARLLTFASAGLTLWLLWGIGRAVYNANAARWTVIVLAFNATFLEWSTEVRTDFLMIPLWVGAVAVVVHPGPRSAVRQMALIGLLMGTAFWVNQKVLLQALPLGAFMLFGGPARRFRPRDVALAVLVSLVPAAMVLGHAWFAGTLQALIEHNFTGAWALVREDPYAATRWRTVLNVLVRDPAFVCLSVAALAGAKAVRTNRRAHVFLIGASVWMALSFLLTPGPFPYYMVQVFPLWAVVIGGWLDRVEGRSSERGLVFWRSQWAAVGLVLSIVFPAMRMTHFVRPTIANQLRVIRASSELLSPESRVFDGAGALIRQPDAYPFHWVLWAGEIAKLEAGQLPPLIPALRENQCQMVIETYRVRNLPQDERTALDHQFVRVWGPLRVPGYDSVQPIGGGETVEFDLWYPRVYESSHPQLIVDGVAMGQPRFLPAGRHVMSLAGVPERVRLVDARIARLAEGLGDDIDPRDFLDRYGYGY